MNNKGDDLYQLLVLFEDEYLEVCCESTKIICIDMLWRLYKRQRKVALHEIKRIDR